MKIFRYKATPFFLVLFVLSIWLLHQNVSSQSFLTKEAVVNIDDGTMIMRNDTMGFYLGGKKIGYSSFVLQEDSKESETKLPGKYYRFLSKMYLKITAMSTPIEVTVNQGGEVNEDLSIRTFTFSYQGSGQNIYMKGEVQGNKLLVTTRSEGQTNRTTVDIKPPLYHTDMVHLVLAKEGLTEGLKREYTVYDPLTQLNKVILTVGEKTSLKLPAGEKKGMHILNIDLNGFQTKCWIDKDGNMYKQTGQIAGINFIALLEDKEKYKDLNIASPDIETETTEQKQDLIDASKVVTKLKVPEPTKVIGMTVKISGARLEDVVIDNKLQTLADKDENSVTIKMVKQNYKIIASTLPQQKPPYKNSDPAMQPYLAEDAFIQVSNPKIHDTAKSITEDSLNSWEASKALAVWLYKNIQKEMRVTIPSAIEVLNTKKGDCNEHSTLFAAFARSLGIPTKIIAGLVYMDDGFYYHAWNEVYINGEWLPIDPTLNRLEMDAAHIKLAEGAMDSQAQLSRLIGNIKIEILDFM